MKALKLHPDDNVAVLVEDGEVGPCRVCEASGGVSETAISLAEPVSFGHKVALQEVPHGGELVKHGVTIGRASRAIRRGEWVHLHNCTSLFDERSALLDPQTGVPTDMEDAYR